MPYDSHTWHAFAPLASLSEINIDCYGPMEGGGYEFYVSNSAGEVKVSDTPDGKKYGKKFPSKTRLIVSAGNLHCKG